MTHAELVNAIQTEAKLTEDQKNMLTGDMLADKGYEWLTFIKLTCNKKTYDEFRKSIYIPSPDERLSADFGFVIKGSDGAYYTGLNGFSNQIRNAKIYRNYKQIKYVLDNNNFPHPDCKIFRIDIAERGEFITTPEKLIYR